MKSIFIALFVVIILGTGAGVVYWLQKPTFSEVPQFTAYATPESSVFEKAQRPIVLIPTFDPRAELASTTYPLERLDQEIEYLIGLSSKREPDHEASFLELYADAAKISTAGGVLASIVENSGRVLTQELISLLWSDIETIVAREQLRLNVARPMQVDLRVNSPIKTPDSPSYPDEMTAKLAILKMLLDELGYEDQTLEEAIAIAVERTHIYGINTRPDTDYAYQLAAAYKEKVRIAHPTFAQFVGIVKDREWSGAALEKMEDGYLSDLSILSMSAEAAEGGVIFTTIIKDLGIASTPATYPVLLEVDVYGDEKIDHQETFSARQLYSEQEDTISYFLPITRKGEHLFRFTLNPDVDFRESAYLNNLSSWQQFSIQ